ncbi:MAG: hypothetical protein K8R90_04155 [Candidatus Cloacimonetes bacterium]|nr:hypothetical protein [Candidatus Cloacimonadota bacterium]
MNKKQRIVIWIGISLIAVCGLLVPYEGNVTVGGINVGQFIGYRLIFLQPSSRDIYKAVWGEPLPSTITENADWRYTAHIITSKVLIHFSTVIVITIGLYFLLADKPGTSPPKKPDLSDE